MAKYYLQPEITGSIMKNYGLPIDSISEYGVVYINEESKMIIGEDGLEHPKTKVLFTYKDEVGNNHTTELDKEIFNSLFKYTCE